VGGGGGGGGPSPEELQNKVFVGGLPLHVDRDGLQDFFSCFGPVTDVSNCSYLLSLSPIFELYTLRSNFRSSRLS